MVCHNPFLLPKCVFCVRICYLCSIAAATQLHCDLWIFRDIIKLHGTIITDDVVKYYIIIFVYELWLRAFSCNLVGSTVTIRPCRSSVSTWYVQNAYYYCIPIIHWICPYLFAVGAQTHSNKRVGRVFSPFLSEFIGSLGRWIWKRKKKMKKNWNLSIFFPDKNARPKFMCFGFIKQKQLVHIRDLVAEYERNETCRSSMYIIWLWRI